jgi:hypothetical protein
MADMSAEALGIYNKLSRLLVAAAVRTGYTTEADLYFSIDEASQNKKASSGASVILVVDVRKVGAQRFFKVLESLLDEDLVLDYRVEYQAYAKSPFVGGLSFDPIRAAVESERRTYALFTERQDKEATDAD